MGKCIHIDLEKLYKLHKSDKFMIKDLIKMFGINAETFYKYLHKTYDLHNDKFIPRTVNGQKRTEDQKAKMRKPKSKSHRKNISKGRKGYKPKIESIEKWKETMAKKGYDHLRTEEYRNKLSRSISGIKRSDSHKKKISDFMKGRPYNNYKRGFYNSSKAGQVFYRSSLELKAYIILDNDDSVLSYSAEPFIIPYIFNGKNRNYRPDILVDYDDGNSILIEVKPESELDWPINKAKFEYAIKYCINNKMEFEIMTDIYLDEAIAKQGELLETLNSYLEQDNQQPSSLNESNIVREKVQRLTNEDDSTNKFDTSALHYNSHVMMI